MAHTPGPWTMSDDGITATIFGPRNEVATTVAITWATGAQSANAKLIAAAPCLLEALKDALDCMEIEEKVANPKWDGSATNFSSIGKARAAIAKAEGA